MSLKNFLPLRREVREHWVYQDNDYFKVWTEMLFAARFSKQPKKDIYEGSLYTINYGEFLFSRPKWSDKLNIKDHKLKKLLTLLISEEMIDKVGRVGKSGATIYLIKNYDKYNNLDSETPALSVGITSVEGNTRQPKTNDTPTKVQPNTNETPLKKNVKNEKSVKNEKISSRFTPPTHEEILEYCKSRNNSVDAQRFIDFYESKGWMVGKNKMKSWQAAVRTWENDSKPSNTTTANPVRNKFNNFNQQTEVSALEQALVRKKQQQAERKANG